MRVLGGMILGGTIAGVFSIIFQKIGICSHWSILVSMLVVVGVCLIQHDN